jgi:gas vesicle protein
MSSTSSKILRAGIAGLAAGVVIGLLFAPAKGAKTRKKLKKALKPLAELLDETVTGKLDILKSVFSSGEDAEIENDDEIENESEIQQ